MNRFTKVKILYYSILILMIIILHYIPISWPIKLLIFVVLAIDSYYILSLLIKRSRMNLLNKKCDPEAFVKRTREHRAITKPGKFFNLVLRAEEAAGLRLMGEFEKALEILEDFNPEIFDKYPQLYRVVLASKMSCLYELKRDEEARNIYDIFHSLPECDEFLGSVKEQKALYKISNGELKDGLKLFEELYRYQKKENFKIQCAYQLAKTYEKLEDIENSKKYYEIAARGNEKMYAAREARNYLRAREGK